MPTPHGGGSRKGIMNRAAGAGREFALKFVNSQEYRDSLMRRIRNDILPSAVEVRLLAYAYGNPPERTELVLPGRSSEEVQSLTDQQLAERAESLAATLRAAGAAARERAAEAEAAGGETDPSGGAAPSGDGGERIH
jgi:hypothetical protein